MDISLVVVLVAQGSALGVEDIPDANSGAEIVNVDGCVESKLVTDGVSSRDGGNAGVAAVVLPDAEVAVDESVVKEENGVGGRGVGVLHDGANAVVSPGVSTTLGAGGHVGVSGTGVASVDDGVTGVDGLSIVTVASQAVANVAGTRADVDGETGELLCLY